MRRAFAIRGIGAGHKRIHILAALNVVRQARPISGELQQEYGHRIRLEARHLIGGHPHKLELAVLGVRTISDRLRKRNPEEAANRLIPHGGYLAAHNRKPARNIVGEPVVFVQHIRRSGVSGQSVGAIAEQRIPQKRRLFVERVQSQRRSLGARYEPRKRVDVAPHGVHPEQRRFHKRSPRAAIRIQQPPARRSVARQEPPRNLRYHHRRVVVKAMGVLLGIGIAEVPRLGFVLCVERNHAIFSLPPTRNREGFVYPPLICG